MYLVKVGLIERFSTIFKSKANSIADKMENPNETLEYSFEKQRELINKLRRDIAQVITAKKQLEMQKAKIAASMTSLEQQARRAINSNREDLARLALERKNMLSLQIQSLDKQIADMQAEQIKLETTERRLSAKIDEFKTRKEIIKAQYTSAEAQVKIKESITGISEEMSDIGLALSRAEEKTEKMKAKAQALDEMTESGILTDLTSPYSNNGADISSELDTISTNASVEEELKKLKEEVNTS